MTGEAPTAATTLNQSFLVADLDAGRLCVLPILEFVMALANLLFDFFRHLVDRGIKVAIMVLGVEVRPANAESNGTFKLPIGGLGMVVFESDAGIDGPAVEMLELLDAHEDMILDGLG